MFRMMDMTGKGEGPTRNDSSAAALFSIAWMLIGSYFAMNLFVGVIVDNFVRHSKQHADDRDGTATMSREQRQ